jgi:Ca2+-binding RTX toxin-like protein
MRVRVLVLGLAFFGFAVALAVQPYIASGHNPSLNKPCTVTGTNGADLLQGTPGPDVICGLGGNDTIGGNSGSDIIRGGAGSDRLQGDLGNDVLLGGAGNDWLWARDGVHDHVNGGNGYDRYRYDQSIDKLKNVEAKM